MTNYWHQTIFTGFVFALFAITINASPIKVYKVDQTITPAAKFNAQNNKKHNPKLKIIATSTIYQAFPITHKPVPNAAKKNKSGNKKTKFSFVP